MSEYIKVGGNAINLAGQRFGKLVALGPVGRKRHEIIWECRCDCGNETTVITNSLRSGATQSCGCLHRQRASEASLTHGMSHDPIFYTWKSMKQRCANPNSATYGNYGGRGIDVCDEWQNSFVTFYSYVSSLPNYGKKGYTLDRENNDGNYEPGNMRWATRVEQNHNKRERRDSRLLTHNGKTQSMSKWIREAKITEGTLRGRLDNGWSGERALTTPVRPKKKKGES